MTMGHDTFRSFFNGKSWVAERNGKALSSHHTQTGSENRIKIEYSVALSAGRTVSVTYLKRGGELKSEINLPRMTVAAE